ncbi:unnamed protein product [Oikopleura dioica]|uniref:TRAF3-interacting protein 1 n=1 Tax=Oikopleura dioica TaxID=34765 RepID=E4XE99_OIKDI|nr:unnamed protein product [Oikopleura dioica]
MGSDFVEKTQQVLGKIIQKPALTEKLLSRPPFRFLHDIVMNLMKKTGFFTGLFPKELLDGKTIADKNDKLKFLQLVIDCISIVSGKTVDVKAAKIVAGQESEQTNKLLQEIAMAILTKKSSDEAVSQIKSGGKAEKTEKSSSKSSNKTKEADKSERKGSRDESKQREKKSDKRAESKPRDDKKGSKERRDKSERRDRDKSKKRETSEERRIRKEKERADRKEKERAERKDRKKGGEEKAERSERRSSRPVRPTSAKGERRRPPPVPENDKEEKKKSSKTAIEETSARPTTKGASRARPGSARPTNKGRAQAPEPPAVVNPNVIRDDDDEEDDNIEIEEVQADSSAIKGAVVAEGDHGALVQDIMESSKNMSKAANVKDKTNKISEAEQKKIEQQIGKLKADVQAITAQLPPVAHVLDLFQEDLDAMSLEYDQWSAELKKNTTLLNEAQNRNHANLDSLYSQLNRFQRETEQREHEIMSTRQQIKINEDRIRKQMAAVCAN